MDPSGNGAHARVRYGSTFMLLFGGAVSKFGSSEELFILDIATMSWR
jgi:hypothetical protein